MVNDSTKSVSQILIDNMEIIYWAHIEMVAHSMLIRAIKKKESNE